MENRVKQAIELFRDGYNCAQSIVGAFEDKLGKDTPTLMDMASGFGGGMGRLQHTCGAVTGSFMVMSTLSKKSNAGSKEKLDEDIQDFARRFTGEFGELNCRKLLGYDLNAPEELEQAHKTEAFDRHCERYIEFSVKTLAKILSPNHGGQ